MFLKKSVGSNQLPSFDPFVFQALRFKKVSTENQAVCKKSVFESGCVNLNCLQKYILNIEMKNSYAISYDLKNRILSDKCFSFYKKCR